MHVKGFTADTSAGFIAALCFFHSSMPAQPAMSSNGPAGVAAFWPNQAPGRRHPAYQVFAYRLPLPSTVVASNQVLIVGGHCGLDLACRNQTAPQLKIVADQFGVPVPVLQRFLDHLKDTPQANAESAAQQLRASVVDYKYLLEKWNQYQPPAASAQLKTDALKLLATGDLEKTWALFNSLPRPAPPAGLRPVAPQPQQ
jgi:hypothetical protein